MTAGHRNAPRTRLFDPALPASLSRRELFGTIAAAGAGLAVTACSSTLKGWRMEELDPRVPGVLERAYSIDMHTHAAGAIASTVPRYDLAAHMRRGRMTAVCLCHAADGPVIRTMPDVGRMRAYRDPQPGELWRFTQWRLAFMDGLVERGGMRRVLTAADLDAAKAAGQPALIGNIEGCQFLEGKLERVQEVYARGIRQLQPIHYLHVPALGDQQTEEPVAGGLGPLGADVIRECNRLGIVVDMAHATYAAVQQAAKLSTVPFILSHTGLARGAPPRYSRTITASHAKLMADRGGVTGVWPARFQFGDAKAWVEGIARMVDVAGVDHVGLGTDMEGGIHEVWADYADLPAVVDLMLKQGFSPDDAAKLMGGNYVRVFRQALAARTA